VKILAIESSVPGVQASAFTPALLQAEAQQAWALYQAGVIRELYFRADRHAAVIMLECDSVDDAQQVLASLPLVAANLIAFDVIPLVAYPGFARLFSQ
jgi:muconolactone delta-isomerase